MDVGAPEAQIIRGRIFEDSTRNAMGGATLSLLHESGAPTGRQVRSDTAGAFGRALQARLANRYQR